MELFRALGAFVEPPGPEIGTLAGLLELGRPPTEPEHTELFVFQLIPCASIYLGPEGMMGGEARDRIAGFWRAIGRTPPAEPDHLTVMLAMAAQLGDSEAAETDPARRDGLSRAAHAFFWEHVASWLPVYLIKVAEIGPSPYAAWARLAVDALTEEAERAGRPDRRSLHLREAPPLDDPRDAGAGAFLQSLLAPVRSGIILTRADLADAALELSLGARLLDRRIALEALMDQDPRSTLTWLAGRARSSGSAYRSRLAAFGDTADFWIERAEKTERLLETLAGEVPHSR